jgi:hypothetical protein
MYRSKLISASLGGIAGKIALQMTIGPGELVEFDQLQDDTLLEPGTLYAQQHGALPKLEAADALLTPAQPSDPALIIQITAARCKKPLSQRGIVNVQRALK